ncbi:hypothetical protein PROFUN_01358 [Planoprotostelium fungivorum]|uniref:Ankyrin repeat-containing protein n=1 Tax=Planoprotostelium fungivorum TaxID=1890364 RepID=A0A2P6NZU2_9EUKA|nr:hypothetical protein PROFUN_01358 [Planoprotostelium fungivorum]
MQERLLSSDVLPLCYLSHYFLTALRARFYEMIALIAPHLKLTVQLCIDIFSPVEESRTIRLQNGWMYEMKESVNLLDLADHELIYLLEPIIKESTETTFNNSILHAVVRSGRTDLLKAMDQKIKFDSTTKNEVLLLAIRAGDEEMVDLLIRSNPVDLSIDLWEAKRVALSGTVGMIRKSYANTPYNHCTYISVFIASQ